MINECIILLSRTQPQDMATVRSSHTGLAPLNTSESSKQSLEAVGTVVDSRARDRNKCSNRVSCVNTVILCHNPVLKRRAAKQEHLKNTMKQGKQKEDVEDLTSK